MEIPTLYPSPSAPDADPTLAYADLRRLSQQAQSGAAALGSSGGPPNTARSYKGSLLYWSAWHALRYSRPIALPVGPDVVLQFIADHLEHLPESTIPLSSPYMYSAQSSQHQLPLAIDQLLVDGLYKVKLGPWS
jgi:hypothetical protein